MEVFTVPVFIAEFDLDTTLIEQYCLDYQLMTGEGRVVSNVGGFQSGDIDKTHLPQLVEAINKNLNAFVESQHLDAELMITNMWINFNGYKDSNFTHIHPNAYWSGVYYVKTPENCGNIIFENPAHDGMEHTYYATQFKEHNLYNSITHWQEVRENILYVFPGWLRHRVQPNLSDENRISISFNIGLV